MNSKFLIGSRQLDGMQPLNCQVSLCTVEVFACESNTNEGGNTRQSSLLSVNPVKGATFFVHIFAFKQKAKIQICLLGCENFLRRRKKMPITIPEGLPAAEILEKENIFALFQKQALHQDIRPLKIAIVNLMPKKIATEIQLLRLLSQSPLQIEVTLLTMADHESKNTSYQHLEKFYKTFSNIRSEKYDALIITGAPVEKLQFEEINYWQELVAIMDWSRSNCTSTLHICWGAQAGLYYHYKVDKIIYPQKIFGIYEQKVRLFHPLTRGFDDYFYSPQSRYTSIDLTDLSRKGLQILAESKTIGPTMLVSKDDKNIFVLGHFEYQTETLKEEYLRDHERGIDTQLPANYFLNNQQNGPIVNRWRGHASLFFSNWINEVYQRTPYDLSQIGE